MTEVIVLKDSVMTSLTIFILDKKVVGLKKVSAIQRYFFREGFEILSAFTLTEIQKKKIIELSERKGWSSDIKEPGAVIIALDLNPIKPSDKVLEYYPQLDNARIFYKDRVMDILGIKRTNHSNPDYFSGKIKSTFTRRYNSLKDRFFIQHEKQDMVDASLSTDEAWEYLNTIMPEAVIQLEEKIKVLTEVFQTPFPVLKRFNGQGRNAKIEIVEYKGEKALCKTFKPGRDAIFRRELQGLMLSHKIKEIPQLIDHGDNWILMAYHERKVRLRKYSLIPLKYVNKIFEALNNLYEEGFAHMDFHIGNIIITKSGEVKMVDFEDLHKYKIKPDTFKESYDIAGVTNHEDAPLKPPRTYTYWYPLTGLKFDSLYNDSIFIQHLKRSLFMIKIVIRKYMLSPLSRMKSYLKERIACYRIHLKNKSHPRKSIHPFDIVPWSQPKHNKKRFRFNIK